MSSLLKDDTWVWVVIQDPGKNEEILGQQDEEEGISFIPAFQSKEEAFQCMNFLARKKEAKYEPQAILYEDLYKYISECGFKIFVLNGEGKLLEKITT